jgi:glucosamine--fructose-6-phosphate aminotransferase (isomerizing)
MLSIMHQEAASAPTIVARQFVENINIIKELVSYLKAHPPTFAFTIARGSSDHAAMFGQYLLMMETGIVTASLPPSIHSIYQCQLNVKNALAIAISQSGASPDICQSLQAAKDAGATTVAIVNTIDSTLASIADFVIPMHAGKEQAVAATKSYIASVSALIQFIAHLSQNTALLKILPKLPESLEEAANADWHKAVTALKDCVNLIVIGRGLGFPIAQEAALKFKETANIHAEAFSGAEFQHGPMALAHPQFPLFFLSQSDVTAPTMQALCKRMTQLDAKTFLATASQQTLDADMARYYLPLPASLHPICDPLLTIQAFYPMVASLALERGYNPDKPINLKKVTDTQ